MNVKILYADSSIHYQFNVTASWVVGDVNITSTNKPFKVSKI
jgi:hypothetical protein